MILCCGEALIDMIPAAMPDGKIVFAPHSGGAVFNTAVALGRLGAETSFMTGLSNDMFGEQLKRDLTASNVHRDCLISSSRPTTLAFVQLTDGQAQYAFFDENSAGRMLSIEDMPRPSDRVSALFFGGISLVSEPAADAYLNFAQREGQNRAVMLDPNVRPAFIKNQEAYRIRLNQMLTVTDILKVSDEDIDWLIPDTAPLDEKIAQLKAKGPKCVIVTKGSKGAETHLPDGARATVPALNTKVVDTVGAGDTFNAGILAHLQSSGNLTKKRIASLDTRMWEDALRHAARAAAVTVSRSGANSPWLRELS